MLHELLHHYHVLVYSFNLNTRFKIMCFTFKIMCFTFKIMCFTFKIMCFTCKIMCFTFEIMCFTFSIDIADINKENSKHYELLVV